MHLLGGPVMFRIAGKLFCQVAAIAQDDCQEIIEIVRDSTRQRPNGLHFLRLPELVFELPAFRKIADRGGYP